MGWLDDTGGKTAKLGLGTHVVDIVRVTSKKKDGSQIVDKQGNPQVVITMSNAQGELDWWAPVSGKMLWKLRAVIAAALTGPEIAELKENGVEPMQFLDDAFAQTHLIGRTVTARGVQNGQYVNFEIGFYDPSIPHNLPPVPPKDLKDEIDDVPF